MSSTAVSLYLSIRCMIGGLGPLGVALLTQHLDGDISKGMLLVPVRLCMRAAAYGLLLLLALLLLPAGAVSTAAACCCCWLSCVVRSHSTPLSLPTCRCRTSYRAPSSTTQRGSSRGSRPSRRPGRPRRRREGAIPFSAMREARLSVYVGDCYYWDCRQLRLGSSGKDGRTGICIER
jgi:hypothetical protein